MQDGLEVVQRDGLDIVTGGGVDIVLDATPAGLLPVVLGLGLAALIWQFWVPRSLRRVQIAFHAGGDDYEVHTISDTSAAARDLLGSRGAGLGVLLYIMAITGVLILSMEILISPRVHNRWTLGIIAVLLGIPILASPISALTAQLSPKAGWRRTDARKSAARRRALLVVVAIALYALVTSVWGSLNAQGVQPQTVASWTILVLLFPAIIAYGRIMGSSWNALVQSKYHRARGRASTINPDPPGGAARVLALVVFANTLFMPLTAVNGVLSFAIQSTSFKDWFTHSDRVLTMEGYQQSSLLGEGGIIGFGMVELSYYIQDIHIRQALVAMVVIFLVLNVTIIGIAFVYEVARLLFLGIASISGRGGIVLAEPRVLRSEREHQARVLSFCFSGFAGYTTLLLVVVLFSRFGEVLPPPASCEAWIPGGPSCPVFDEDVLEQLTLTLAVAGQAVFLVIWMASLGRIGRLKRARFDLNADEERKAGAEGTRRRRLVDEERDLAQLVADDDLDEVRARLAELVGTDDASERDERARGEMLLAAAQGSWRIAEERATSLLAQQGGENDEARKVLAVSALAQRDLDEARFRLVGLPDDDAEVLMMRWMIAVFDPHGGDFPQERMAEVQHTPAGRRLRDLLDRYATWHPWTRDTTPRISPLDERALLADIQLLRQRGLSSKALQVVDEWVETLGEEAAGDWPRLLVARALLFLDLNDVGQAMSLHERLMADHAQHPAVAGLTEVLRSQGQLPISIHNLRDQWLPEVILATEDPSYIEWGELVDQVPTNAVAALRLGRRGQDEALAANAWIVSGQASAAAIHPSRPTPFAARRTLAVLSLLVPLFFVGVDAWQLALISLALLLGGRHLLMRRDRHIRHRDQPAMRRLAARLRRAKAMPRKGDLPPGTHLLAAGLLLEVGGVTVDLGFPAWLDPLAAAERQLLPGVVVRRLTARQMKRTLREASRRAPSVAGVQLGRARQLAAMGHGRHQAALSATPKLHPRLANIRPPPRHAPLSAAIVQRLGRGGRRRPVPVPTPPPRSHLPSYDPLEMMARGVAGATPSAGPGQLGGRRTV